MSRQIRERRIEAEERWPRLRALVSRLGSARFSDILEQVAARLSPDEIDPIIQEWNDWNGAHGWRANADAYVMDGLGSLNSFNDDVEARAFMNRIYDILKERSCTPTMGQTR
jgi:hypothetical protein